MRAETKEIISRGLDDLQRRFVSVFVATGDANRARDESGYSPKTATSHILSSHAVARAIALAVRIELGACAPMALNVLKHLAKNGATERVRLDAAKTLLDRGGHVAPKAREAENAGETPLHEMSTEGLRSLASKLEEEIAGRAKDISSTDAAPHPDNLVELIG